MKDIIITTLPSAYSLWFLGNMICIWLFSHIFAVFVQNMRNLQKTWFWKDRFFENQICIILFINPISQTWICMLCCGNDRLMLFLSEKLIKCKHRHQNPNPAILLMLELYTLKHMVAKRLSVDPANHYLAELLRIKMTFIYEI